MKSYFQYLSEKVFNHCLACHKHNHKLMVRKKGIGQSLTWWSLMYLGYFYVWKIFKNKKRGKNGFGCLHTTVNSQVSKTGWGWLGPLCDNIQKKCVERNTWEGFHYLSILGQRWWVVVYNGYFPLLTFLMTNMPHFFCPWSDVAGFSPSSSSFSGRHKNCCEY